jgi:hypothetical protein
MEPTPLHIIFLDHTDEKNPVELTTAVLSFSPNFNPGDKLTFSTSKEVGGKAEHAIDVSGKDVTHTVKSINWLFSIVEYEENGDTKETEAYPTLIVNVQGIKAKTGRRINYRDGN